MRGRFIITLVRKKKNQFPDGAAVWGEGACSPHVCVGSLRGPRCPPASPGCAEEANRRLQGPGAGVSGPVVRVPPVPGGAPPARRPELPGWAPAPRHPPRESAGCEVIVYLVFISLSGVHV